MISTDECSLLTREIAKQKDYPDKEEMAQLNIRRLNGDESARDEMFKRNMKLAIWYANTKSHPANPDYHDIVQECLIGVAEAVDNFDHTRISVHTKKEASFATFAEWRMKAKIQKFRRKNSKTIRVNADAEKSIGKVKRCAHKLEGELRRKPTIKEIAKECDFSTKYVERLFLIPTTTSLNIKMEGADSEGGELSEVIADKDAMSPANAAALISDAKTLSENLEELYDFISNSDLALSNRNYRIFGCRYGLFGYKDPKTLEEVGSEFGITRERVRQVCSVIFKKRANLKLPISNKEQLNNVLNDIRSGIELSFRGNFSKRVLWLAGLESDEESETFEVARFQKNSVDEILSRLTNMVSNLFPKKIKSEIKMIVCFIAHKDFNISVKDSCYKLSISITEVKEVSEEILKAIRSKYDLSILCSDPKEIWERQGQLFPSQVNEANKILIKIKKEKWRIDSLILNKIEGVPVDFQQALIDRYQINEGGNPIIDDIAFSSIAAIKPSEVKSAIKNLWKYITKSTKSELIQSETQYLRAKDQIEYFSLLLE